MEIMRIKDLTIMTLIQEKVIPDMKEKKLSRIPLVELEIQMVIQDQTLDINHIMFQVFIYILFIYLFILFLDEVPKDCTVTLNCTNVPGNFNGKELQRKLANDGYHVLDYKFKHDILTGERAGTGTIHVR